MPKIITESHKTILRNIMRAAENEDLGLAICRRKSTGEEVTVLIAKGILDGKPIVMPLCQLVEGNPFEEFDPPMLGGGYGNAAARADEEADKAKEAAIPPLGSKDRLAAGYCRGCDRSKDSSEWRAGRNGFCTKCVRERTCHECDAIINQDDPLPTCDDGPYCEAHPPSDDTCKHCSTGGKAYEDGMYGMCTSCVKERECHDCGEVFDQDDELDNNDGKRTCSDCMLPKCKNCESRYDADSEGGGGYCNDCVCRACSEEVQTDDSHWCKDCEGIRTCDDCGDVKDEEIPVIDDQRRCDDCQEADATDEAEA